MLMSLISAMSTSTEGQIETFKNVPTHFNAYFIDGQNLFSTFQ